jgi:hypothetical protein
MIFTGMLAVSQYPGGDFILIMIFKGNTGLGVLIELLARFHGLPEVHTMPQWFSIVAKAMAVLLISGDFVYFIIIGRRKFHHLFWFVAAYVPVVILFLVAQWKPVLYPRWIIISGAVMWYTHTITISTLRPIAQRIIIIPIIVILGIGVYFNLTNERFTPYHTYTERILPLVKNREVLVLMPDMQQYPLEYQAEKLGLTMPDYITIPVATHPSFSESIKSLPQKVRDYKRAWVLYELPGLWDPEGIVQDYFETQWKPSPQYFPLWGQRWVLTYYDNPDLQDVHDQTRDSEHK